MANIKHFVFNGFQERCSAVWDEDGICALIDPGFENSAEKEQLYGFIENKNLTVRAILLTHAHFDHIYGLKEAAGHFDVPVYMHCKEEMTISQANPVLCGIFGLPLPDTGGVGFNLFGSTSEEGGTHEVIEVGKMKFEVLETPGHTPGGVCYLERDEKLLFSGDTLFAGSIGRTDNNWGDYDALMKGISEQLLTLDGDICVIPGHGGNTDIATERMTNPFLLPFNEPETINQY